MFYAYHNNIMTLITEKFINILVYIIAQKLCHKTILTYLNEALKIKKLTFKIVSALLR